MIDDENRELYIYSNGAEIVSDTERNGVHKEAVSLDALEQLATTPFVTLFSATGVIFTDIITPRQAVNVQSGIVTLAHNRTNETVWFSEEALESGPATVPVPNVVGQSQANAETAIQAAGLTVGSVTEASSDTTPAGSVISQNPAAGEQVLPGTTVDLVVSTGPETGIDLGEAGAFAVLGLSGAKVKMDNENPGVIGKVGVGANGEQDLKTGFITGQLSLDPTATNGIPGTAVQGGIVVTGLGQAAADALRTSSDVAALAASRTFGDVKESLTVDASGPLTVVAMNKIELKDNKVLTLRGGPNDQFVVNIADILKLENGSMIRLEGGLQARNVIFNFLKNDASGEIKSGSSASGIFLATGNKAKLKLEDSGSSVVGVLIAGEEVSISKNARIIHFSEPIDDSVDIGAAGAFTVLGLTGANVKMDGDNPSVLGDVGLGPNGKQDLKNGFIAGRLLIDPTAENENPGTDVQGGTTIEALAPAVAAALRASSDASVLAATRSFGDIKETQTIASNGQLTVVAVNKIELKDGKVLTLSGGQDDQFVLNIADNLKLENGSAIQLQGGLQAGNVFFNFVKNDASGEIKSGSIASGLFLAPGDKAKLKLEDPGTTVVGALFAGSEVSINKDARIVQFGQ